MAEYFLKAGFDVIDALWAATLVGGGELCKWAAAESIIVICVWCLQSWRYSDPQNSRITLVLV